MHLELQHAFPVVFIAIAGYIIYQVATKGFKGALFGGKISKSYGEIMLARTGFMSVRLEVHGVSTENGNRIGIEIVHKTLLSYHLLPVTLSKPEAQELARLLSSAAAEVNG